MPSETPNSQIFWIFLFSFPILLERVRFFSVLPFAHFPIPWDVLIPFFFGMFLPSSLECFNPIPWDVLIQFLRIFKSQSLGHFNPIFLGCFHPIPRDVLFSFFRIFSSHSLGYFNPFSKMFSPNSSGCFHPIPQQEFFHL